jgi:hypothetical protein
MQQAWNFGRMVSFARPKTTERGHRSKRRNEKNDDCNFEKNQCPAREHPQGSRHQLCKTTNRTLELQKTSTMSARPLFQEINCAMRVVALD